MTGHGDPSFGNGRPTLGRMVLIWKTALKLAKENQIYSRAVGKMYAHCAESSGYVANEPERLGPQTGSSGNRQSPDADANMRAGKSGPGFVNRRMDFVIVTLVKRIRLPAHPPSLRIERKYP